MDPHLVESHDTIIIGAGPAGLAVAASLKKAHIGSLILEKNEKVGSAWRRHYERLHLHTDKTRSELPYMPYPSGYPRYPSRLQVIEYLEDYADHFQLAPRFRHEVLKAYRAEGNWVVETENGRCQAANLVVASGYNHQPIIPDWPGKASFQGPILHSSQYRSGEGFKGQDVLVVGFGNSGGEIAIDLWEHGARPSLSVRSAVNVIPKELFGMPILAIGIVQSKLPPRVADMFTAPILRAKFGDLSKYGLRKLPYGPAVQIRQDNRIPLIDVGTIKLIKEGQLSVHPGIDSFTPEAVVFVDGTRRPFDAVVLATGYKPRVNGFLEGVSAVLNENGQPLVSGRACSLPGLYFCGFFVSPTGMLREIAIEAQQICRDIVHNV